MARKSFTNEYKIAAVQCKGNSVYHQHYKQRLLEKENKELREEIELLKSI